MKCFQFIFIIVALSALQACSKQNVTEIHRHEEVDSEVVKYLTSLEASSNIYEEDVQKPLEKCDAEAVSKIIDEKIPQGSTQEKAQKLWQNCLTIMSCEESAKKFVLDNAIKSNHTRLSFMDYKELKKTQMQNDSVVGNQKYFQNNTMNGMYLSSNKTIYLDKVLKTNYEACSVMYHELVHRHDPEAQQGKDNVPREFRAYYAQILASGELMMNENTKRLVSGGYRFHIQAYKVAEGVTVPKLHTRDSVMNMVSNSMDDDSQKSYAEQFAKFPWEEKTPSEEKPKAAE